MSQTVRSLPVFKKLQPLETEDQLDEFALLIKKGYKHKDAGEFTQYKPIQYRQYLRNIKSSAGQRLKTSSQQRPCTSTKHSKILPQKLEKEKPSVRSRSHYYNNKCELLSLKQFNILVEQAQYDMKWTRHRQQRADNKKLILDIERTIQPLPESRVRLRLTSAVAQKIKKMIDN